MRQARPSLAAKSGALKAANGLTKSRSEPLFSKGGDFTHNVIARVEECLGLREPTPLEHPPCILLESHNATPHTAGHQHLRGVR